MSYVKRVLIAVDQLAAVVFFGCMPDETISAMAHRRQWTKLEKAINWAFRDEFHCASAYVAEMNAEQNAKEYRK